MLDTTEKKQPVGKINGASSTMEENEQCPEDVTLSEGTELKQTEAVNGSRRPLLGFSVPLPPPLPAVNRCASSVPGAHAIMSPIPSPHRLGVEVVAEHPEDHSNDTASADDSTLAAEGLTRARAVSAPTEIAEPVYKRKDRDNRGSSCRLTIAVLVTVIVAVCIVTTVTVFLKSDHSNQDGGESTLGQVNGTLEAPAFESNTNQSLILDLPLSLPNNTLQALVQPMDGINMSTPQQQAYRWMQQDPWLATYPDERLMQRFALATLFHSTIGRNWTHAGGDPVSFPGNAFQGPDVTTALYTAEKEKVYNGGSVNITSQEWMSYKTDECAWFSLASLKRERTCLANDDDYSFRYNYLDVEGNNLEGTIPPEIGLLTNLQGIFLGHSHIHGPIVSQIGSLTQLRTLDLVNSSLSGTIPTEIGLLSDTLQNVVLAINKFSGSFPSEFWQLSNLHQIIIGQNQLTGTLPNDLGNLVPELNLLMVYGNSLEGTLPSLGLMTDLLIIDIAENEFTGSLPSQLGKLTNVTRLFLANNNLAGVLPSELALLTSLTKLNVQGNRDMSGVFPSELGLLNNTLISLNLRDTAITGTIPEELCSVKKLKFHCSELLCGCDHCPCYRY